LLPLSFHDGAPQVGDNPSITLTPMAMTTIQVRKFFFFLMSLLPKDFIDD
jgi:hypothetical protein